MVDIVSPIGFLSPCYTAPSPTTNNWPLVRTRLKTLNRLGIAVRGHGLLCPRRPYLPTWMGGVARHSNVWQDKLHSYPTVSNREQTWLNQVKNACHYTKGLVVCQDVCSQVFGPAGFKPITLVPDLFAIAREVDPTTPKFINEVLTIPDKSWDVFASRLDTFRPDGLSVQVHANLDSDFNQIAVKLRRIGDLAQLAGLRFQVSEVQIPAPDKSFDSFTKQAIAHQILFEAACDVDAECYIVWGDHDLVAGIPITNEKTLSSGFRDDKLPVSVKPSMAALLSHARRRPYRG
jgi:hypothetical protein